MNNRNPIILAGDIGGTKTNLVLFEIVDKKLDLRQQYQYPSHSFATFSKLLENFKKESAYPLIDAICFGIAGPVIDGYCHTTNLPWSISSVELQKEFKSEKVHIINDLVATAYGMLYLPEDAFVDLNPEAKKVEGNRAVIAAGTGLGEAMLYHDGRAYHPIGSEGGHSDFAPLTRQQDELLLWMRKRYPDHVSYERVLSGPGIYTLYEFLKQSQFTPQSSFMAQIKEGEDPSAKVSEAALKHKDPLCVETLRLFWEIYAAEAGNLALKSMATGGVFIGGGIAPKILSTLSYDAFMQNFSAKGRFQKMLKGMRVRVSLNQETALLGAAHFAKDRFF